MQIPHVQYIDPVSSLPLVKTTVDPSRDPEYMHSVHAGPPIMHAHTTKTDLMRLKIKNVAKEVSIAFRTHCI
jgi:hypothetical protein